MFHRRPSERLSPMFSTAERPVCVPYKRKTFRTNQKQSAVALVCKKEINLTSWNGKKLVATVRRCERIYKRTAEPSETFWREEERRSEHSGEERSRKRPAVRDDESAFTSEQQRRGVTFFGEEEQDKRADVTRRSAGRSLAVFATTRRVDIVELCGKIK